MVIKYVELGPFYSLLLFYLLRTAMRACPVPNTLGSAESAEQFNNAAEIFDPLEEETVIEDDISEEDDGKFSCDRGIGKIRAIMTSLFKVT